MNSSTVWIDSIRATLEILQQKCSHLPKGERLRADELNNVIDLMEECKFLFVTQFELQGFKFEKIKKK